MHIILKVTKHPSGRHTLSEKKQGASTFADCKGDLLGNTDAASFYKAVAQYMAGVNMAGHSVVFQDCAD